MFSRADILQMIVVIRRVVYILFLLLTKEVDERHE